jgi:hypothetical protein
MNIHDAYSWGLGQNLTYSTSGGAAVSTTGFASQTKFVRLAALGIQTATNGVRYKVGKAPAATSSDQYLPIGWVEVIQIAAGEQVSALGTDTTTGMLSISECLT